MPPPSSGGIAVAQTLGILENFDMSLYPPKNPENEGGVPDVMGVHLVSEAERLAYADRDKNGTLSLAEVEIIQGDNRLRSEAMTA